jgi:hypothetical protein
MKVLATICLLLVQQKATAAPDTVSRAGEQAVLSAYQRMEEADRKGDGQLWLSLRDRKTQDTMNQGLKDAIRKGGHSRPNIQYQPLAQRVDKNRAIILGKVSDPDAKSVQYEAVLFAIEDGGWKVTQEQWSERPFDSFVMYAFLEPEDGSFVSAGSPWKPVPYASVNTQTVRKEDVGWKTQAIFDEAFVYIRFEAALPVPAGGSKVRPEVGKAGKTGGPPPPQPMRVKVSVPSLETQKEYSISVSALVATTDAMGAKGKPSTSYSVTYSLFVKNADGDEVFESTLGDGTSSRMLSVHDRFIDVKIPLGGFGADPVNPLKVDLEDADTVLRVLPYHVDAFVQR